MSFESLGDAQSKAEEDAGDFQFAIQTMKNVPTKSSQMSPWDPYTRVL